MCAFSLCGGEESTRGEDYACAVQESKAQTQGKPFPTLRSVRPAVCRTRSPLRAKGLMSLRGCRGGAPLPAGSSHLLPPPWQPEPQAAMPREMGLSLSDRDVYFQLKVVSPCICFEIGRIFFSHPSRSVIFPFPCVSK